MGWTIESRIKRKASRIVCISKKNGPSYVIYKQTTLLGTFQGTSDERWWRSPHAMMQGKKPGHQIGANDWRNIASFNHRPIEMLRRTTDSRRMAWLRQTSREDKLPRPSKTKEDPDSQTRKLKLRRVMPRTTGPFT